MGRQNARQVLSEAWREVSDYDRERYRRMAANAREINAHFPCVGNLPSGVIDNYPTPASRAWKKVKGERSHGIGQDMDEFEHFDQVLAEDQTL